MSGSYATTVADRLRELAERADLDKRIAQVLPYGEQRRLMTLLDRLTPIDEVVTGERAAP